MSKVFHVQDAALMRALEDGTDYLIAGRRHFLLVEVGEASEEPYTITDPQEIARVRNAMQSTRPLMSGDEARTYLKSRLKERGIR